MSQLAHTRPRSITEIIDATFSFYRARFGDLMVVSTFLYAPPALLTSIAPAWLRPRIQLASNWIYFIAEGAVAILVAAAIERGEALSAGGVFRELGRKCGKVIVVSFVSALMIVTGAVLFIIPGIIALSWTMVAIPVAAIEGLWSGPAILRSRALSRGHMLHVLGTMLLTWVIVAVLLVGIALMAGVIDAIIPLPDRFPALIGRLVMVPLIPLIGITVTLLYYDLRVRSEGADVAAMIDALPATPAAM